MKPTLTQRARRSAIAIVAVAALGLTACSGETNVDRGGDVATLDGGISASIDEAVASAMEQSGSTQAVVGVWSGENAYVSGYGDGVDGNSRFYGTQASTPFICALLLDLVEEGELELDREITEDLTRQSGIEGVTYAQLCNMKSGLADYKGAFTDIFANNPTRYWPEQELIAQGLTKSPRPWPGLNVNVSDTNPLLLGRTLQVETMQPLRDLLQERVYTTAGMPSSYYPAMASGELPDGSLEGLTYPTSDGKPVCDADPVSVTEISPSMLGGAGATVTTVTDLKNFYTAYLGGEFGGEHAGVVTESQSIKNPERDEDGNPTEEIAEGGDEWAFGMAKVGPMYGKSGAITGNLTAAFHDPDSDFTVALALNNSSAGLGFARALALELAAISSEGGDGPELPWTAEQQASQRAKSAVCQ